MKKPFKSPVYENAIRCRVQCTGERPMPKLLTVGEITRRLNEPAHRVEYVIRSRNIREAGRAGAYRVFTEADCEYIRHELARIDREREGVFA